jgi:2-amino-4-hydroxy-6-hydroxymethyldihydropteridine diphosphokinase
MREPVTAFIALGANLGDAAATLRAAVAAIDRLPGTRVVRRSSLYRTAPHEASGPDFINAVVEVSTCLCAPELLAGLQQLELAAGRERPYPNAPRMMERAFVLVPLSEIAPARVTAAQLQAVSGQVISLAAE